MCEFGVSKIPCLGKEFLKVHNSASENKKIELQIKNLKNEQSNMFPILI